MLAFLVGFVVSQASLDRGDILRELKRQDKLATSGRIQLSYHVEESSEGTFDTDAAIRYKGSEYVIELKTDSDSAVLWQDGKWKLDANGNTVRIDGADRPDNVKVDPAAAPFGIGPLFCEGRGLTTLDDIQIDVKGNVVKLSAKYHGQTVKADLDPAFQYAAKRIEFFAPGGTTPIETYVNSQFKKNKNGFVYSQLCECFHIGNTTKRRFEIKDLQTGLTSLDRPEWLRKNWVISDSRVSPGIAYQYDDILNLGGGKPLTLDELYEITLKKRKAFNIRKARGEAIVKQAQKRKEAERSGRFVFVLLLGVGGISLIAVARWLMKTRYVG